MSTGSDFRVERAVLSVRVFQKIGGCGMAFKFGGQIVLSLPFTLFAGANAWVNVVLRPDGELSRRSKRTRAVT